MTHPHRSPPAKPLRATLAAIALCAPFLAAPALAEAPWPSQPIRVIVPYPPGGPSDIVLRSATETMREELHQPILIENKPGAGGNVGAAEAAHAAPDGYTWFWTTDTVMTVNPKVYSRLNFKPENLVPVSVASSFSQTLVCNRESGIKSVADLVKRARTEKMSYASGGNGVPGHLAMELLLSSAGVKMQHVPYKGPAPAMADVMGGQLPCGFLAGPTVLPQVKSGRLTALAVSGKDRSPMLPDVPTVAEAGYPGFDATFLLVMYAPKGTPEPIIERFQQSLARALKSPATVQRLKDTDQHVVASTPAEAAVRIDALSAQWAPVIQRIGLHMN